MVCRGGGELTEKIPVRSEKTKISVIVGQFFINAPTEKMPRRVNGKE